MTAVEVRGEGGSGTGTKVLNGLLLVLLVLWIAMAFFGVKIPELNLLGARIRANDPGKPLLLLVILGSIRLLMAIEAKNRLLLLGSITFSLLVGEVGLRILDVPLARMSRLKKWHRPAPETSYALVPGMEFTTHLGPVVQVNSHGLRDHERPWEKPDGQFRIVALGDSFTFGLGVPVEGVYHRQLEELMKADGRDVDVINGGLAGLHAFHLTRHFETKLHKYQPDLVTFGFFFDDIQPPYTDEEMRVEYEGRVAAEKAEEAAAAQKTRKLKHRIKAAFQGLYLVRFMKNVYQVLWQGKFRSYTRDQWLQTHDYRVKGFEEQEWGSWLEGKYPRMEEAYGVLRRLKASVKKAGAKLVILYIPESAQIGMPKWQVLNRMIGDFCRSEGIPFVDATPDFEKDPDFLRLYLYPRDAHTSVAGHRVIAEALKRRLEELSLLPAPGSK